MGTFFGLVLNALLAGVVAPVVATSLTTLALTACAFAAVGSLFWFWHRATIGTGRTA